MQNGEKYSESPPASDIEDGATNEKEKGDPSGFLSAAIGQSVTVKLNSGGTFKGELQSVDGYMNVALERAREVDDQGRAIRRWGDAFLRGNNVAYICADDA